MKDKNTAKSYRGKKINNNKGADSRKRIIICGIVFVLLIGIIVPSVVLNRGGGIMEIKTHAANKDNVPANTVFSAEDDRVTTYSVGANTYDLSNSDRIIDFSKAYYSFPEKYQNATIILGVTNGSYDPEILADFIALGTETVPFNGTVRVISSADKTLQLPEAFFDYVFDSVKFIENERPENEADTSLLFQRTTVANEPVLARHVVHDENLSTANTWKVTVAPYSSNNYQTAGFIGEMMRGALLDIEITDNTTMNIENNASGEDDVKDVGYVCGVMQKDSVLTVKSITRSANANYTVSSNTGNAGGAVGRMMEGATLSLGCEMPKTTAAITASGSGTYAGGIVGYNDGGSVISGKNSSNVDIFSSSSRYNIDNTVSGTSGSGGVFGYYNPAFDDNGTASFDISWLQVGTDASTRMNANGTGAAGGLFGVLSNEIKTTTGEGEQATTSYSSGDLTITDRSAANNKSVVYADHTAGNAANYGGLIGKYTARELSGSLTIKDIEVNADRSGGSYVNYGGGIGETAGGTGNSNNAVYVKFDNFNAEVISGNNESGKLYGGLVASSHNAFIDANDVTLKSDTNFTGGGVVGNMEDGVLRLSGTTNLTDGKAPAADENQGQIVGGRDNSLVFAEAGWELKRGDACSVDDIGSWGEVLRFDGKSTTASTTSETLGGNTVITVDETAHTVEVASHTVSGGATTVSNKADFAKVALCFQLKASENPCPCLSFEDDWCDRSNVTALDITLGADIDLTGTGLTGFTRDNSFYVTVVQPDKTTRVEHPEYCKYSGNFDGAGYKITLATGEPYGSRGNTQLTSHSAEGNGKIYRHRYTGLFGYTDSNYTTSDLTVKDLTIDGTVDISAQTGPFYCGGFAAKTTKAFTAKDVNTDIEMTNGGGSVLYMGRLVGEMATDTTNIDISSENSTCVFGGSINGNNSNADTCLGGVIGRISHNNDQSRTWNFKNVTLEGSIDNTSVKTKQKIGGLIAVIDGSYTGNANHRMLTLDGVTVNGLQVSGSLKDSGSSMGGLLGYSWLKTDVDLKDVTVQDKSGTKSTVSIGSAAGNTAGLVYLATGRWDVQSLNIDNIKMTASNANSVGMIVNCGHFFNINETGKNFYSASSRSAIYLRLPSATRYSLVLDDSSDIKSSAVYDELCAYTCPSEADIMKNGNGIISVHTDFYTDDGTTASGTYHAQTTYGAKPNPNSRYYYNLDSIDNTIDNSLATVDNSTAKLTTAPKKLMSWGVNVYACANLKQYFADKFNGTITDETDETYDMQNFSWYPVTLNKSITVNGTFKLYNKEFEGSEKAKFNNESTNAYWRTSLYDSTNSKNTQHYLMHNALFYNVESCTLNLGAVTLQGDVAGYTQSGTSASICGALVCGTVSGSSTSNVGTVKMTGSGSVTLDGIEIYNDESAVGKATEVSSYAPLLINKLGSHSALNLANVTTTTAYNYDSDNDNTNDSTHIVATSLVGDAGSSTATDINIEFKKITLDARNASGEADTSHLGNASEGNFLSTANNDPTTSMYQTYRSIFSHATLLNSFSFGSNSTGRYDYTWKEDWDVNDDDNPDASHKGNVTYGKELGYDLVNFPVTGAENPYYNSQYPKEEIMYVGQTTYYTNPINGNDTTSDYGSYGLANYRNNFLPYVYTRYNAENKTYQLRVNHAAAITAGCGTYNHPYIIYSGSDIEKYCRWINEGSFNHNDVIRIPTAGLELSEDDDILAITGTWCETNSDHADCTYDGSAGYFTVTINNNPKTISPEVMRKYLAGAYYQIDPDVSNNDLVINVNLDETRTFKGFGATDNAAYRFRGVIDGSGKIITNKTTAPFIYYSNGCVVKNLTISVEPDNDILLVGYQKSFDLMWQSKSADNADGNAAYGAVIARVMGGDTIIDNVYVSFANMTTHFDLRAKFAQLVPVGGYVGVVVNGGVIFRNMQDVNGEPGPASAYAASGVGLRDSLIYGNTNTAYKPTGASSNLADAAGYTTTGGYLESNAWLYVNPMVGRVINGFAVTEGDYYLPYEDGSRVYKGGETDVTKYWNKTAQEETSTETNDHVTLQNGVKHYSIADINKNGNKVGIDGNAVTIGDGQAFFIMSLIVNSGMANKSLGYNQQYFVSRSADYTYIGTETKTDYTGKAENDYLPYNSTAADSYKTTQFGYLANKYTSTLSNTGVLENNPDLTVELSGDIYLPDGYKGIGNMYNDNDNYRLKAADFDGNKHTVSINSSWNYYFIDKNNDGTLENDDFDKAYPHHDHPGFGLFNYQSGATSSDSSCYHDFILTGNVTTECINSASATGEHIVYVCSNKNGNFAGYISTDRNVDNNKMVSAGGLMGVASASQYLDSVALQNIYVHGIRNAGGLIGMNIAPSNGKFTYRNTESTESQEIKIISAASAGGMIGKTQGASIDIDNNNASYSITEVSSECTRAPVDGNGDWNNGVGAFIGACRAEDSNTISISQIVVGSENQSKPSFVKAEHAPIFAGGMIGIINRGILTITDCTIYNQSVVTRYIAGGLAGYCATPFGTSSISGVKVLAKDYDTEHSGIENPKITSENKAAGGFIGAVKNEFTKTASNVGTINIYDSEICGYYISVTNSTDNCYAGGIIGLFGHNSGNNNSYIWNLYNVSVSDCSVNAESTANNKNGYSGGLVGGIAEIDGKYKHLYGYNILTKNLDIKGDKPGGIYGKMYNATDCCIKLAGFSRQGTPMIEALAGAPAVADKLFGNDGYVVFADYNDKASTEQNKLFPSLGYTVNNVVDTIGLGTTVTTTTNRYVVLRNSESADDSIGAGNVTVVSSLPEVVETNSGAYDSTLTAGTTTSYIRLRAAARDGFYLRLENIKKGGTVQNGGPYYFKLPQGSVLPETTNAAEAVKWYFEPDGNYYRMYTYDSGNVKKYLHKKNNSDTDIELSASEYSLLEIDNTIIDSTEISHIKLQGTTKTYLQYSNSGKGVRFYKDKPAATELFNYEFKLVSSGTKDYNNVTYRVWEYDSLNISGSSITSVNAPSSKSDATAAQQADYTANCGSYNSDDYELFYVIETVVEQNTSFEDNSKPYVTTNPRTDISATQFLTSDGAGYLGSAVSYPYSSIGTILSDVSAGTSPKRYTIANSAVGADPTTALITKLTTYGKLSSYQQETGANSGTSYDFPILIVDEVLEDDCTSYINAYLQYLTNTDFNFADGSDSSTNKNIFNIEIGSMIWDGTKFVYTSGRYNANSNPGGAYFYNKKEEQKFSIDGKRFDNTENGRFTLLDVQFYDPGDTATGTNRKIAYHVYVPIIVKKMLQYDFNTAMLSGTNYRVQPYIDANGSTLIENIGNTVTMLAQWKYRRTLAEWQKELESGNNFLIALDKTLKLKIPTGKFPSGTQMVLVDANNNNKYYQAVTNTQDLITLDSGNEYFFDLSKFSDGVNTFSPIEFNDMFTFTVTAAGPDDTTKFAIVPSPEAGTTEQDYINAGATVCINGVYYKPASDGTYDIQLAYKNDSGSDGYLTENYYISFFTDSTATTTDNTDLYHLHFFDRGTFNEPSYPTKVLNNSNTHFLTGNIFVNNISLSNLNPEQAMSAVNNEIYATLTAEIGINPDQRSIVQSYLSPTNDKVTVYQSLLVMLNKLEDGEQQKGILTTPGVNVTNFKISRKDNNDVLIADADPKAHLPNDVTNDYIEYITQNYVEIRTNLNLRDYLYSSCDAGYNLSVQANVNLSYTDLGIQFPTRDSANLQNDNIGTVMGASSNISSTSAAAAYSKTAYEAWSTLAYYITANTNAILTLNSDDNTNPFGDYYQLGVNDLDMEADYLDLDEYGNSKMKLNALYDVSDLSTADEAKLMKLTISVRKKADYRVLLNIDDYITDLVLKDANGTSFASNNNITVNETADAVEYTYIIRNPRTTLQYDADSKTYQIPITYTVYSAENFASLNPNSTFQYSNYMINLNAKLYRDYTANNTNYLEGSNDDDHVIWTNAKIVYNVFEN